MRPTPLRPTHLRPPTMPTIAYPLPPGLDRDPDLTISVDGQLAGVGLTPVASYAVCAIDGPATIEIGSDLPLAGAVVRPAARGLALEQRNGRLRLAVDRPGPLTIEAPGRKPIHLFIHPPAERVPRRDDPAVRWLEAGRVHDLGEVRLAAGQTLWIEGGAALRGWIRADQARGVRIAGHGIVDGGAFPKGWRQSVLLAACDDAIVEGIAVIGSPSWTIVLAACDRAVVRRVNLIGWVVSSDGIDVVGCRDVLVEDCFLRCNDDCIAVKATPIGLGELPLRDVARVLAQRCVCWNDQAGNVLEIGYETRCERISGVVFRDIDVIGAHGEGGVLTIHAGDRAEICDVLYEDIRIEHMYDKFIDFRVLFSRYSKDAQRGRIHDVTLRRIRACHDPYNTVSLLGGFDAGHQVEGIRFEDVRIGGLTLASADDLHLFTRHARDITVSEPAPAARAVPAPSI